MKNKIPKHLEIPGLCLHLTRVSAVNTKANLCKHHLATFSSGFLTWKCLICYQSILISKIIRDLACSSWFRLIMCMRTGWGHECWKAVAKRIVRQNLGVIQNTRQTSDCQSRSEKRNLNTASRSMYGLPNFGDWLKEKHSIVSSTSGELIAFKWN